MDTTHKLISRRQRGAFSFIHAMLLVVVAVGLTYCISRDSVPYFQQRVPVLGQFEKPEMPNVSGLIPWSREPGQQAPMTDNPNQGVVQWTGQATQQQLPTQQQPVTTDLFVQPTGVHVAPDLTDAPYDVQFPKNLARGFYTVQVFSGYNSQYAYDLRRSLLNDGYQAYIRQEAKAEGVLFKVRIGQYRNRADAFAIRAQVRRRYPKTLGGSYVILSPQPAQ